MDTNLTNAELYFSSDLGRAALVVDCLGEEKIFVNNVNIENFILNVMSSS
jgi:hypothetical protein